MKSRIGIALFGLALLASCTSESDITAVSEGPEVISLGASTGDATRAAINDLKGLSAEGAKVGIYGQATTATAANTSITSEWTASPLMKDVKTTAIDAVTGLMKWETVYAYPKADPKNVKFFAYYPYAAESTTGANYVKAPGIGLPPVYNFTLTGEEDLMWATPVLGSRTTPAGALKFNHQLTQMTFKLIDAEGTFTEQITSVSIMTNTVGKMNIETGALSNWVTPKACSLNAGNISMSDYTTHEVALPKTVMLQPELVEFEVSVVAGGLKKATIKPVGDATFKAGKSYLITLRLSGDMPIQTTAEVVPWVTGGLGEGSVE